MSNPHTWEEGELTFTVDSGLLFELGEQLVAKPSIALAELVKNAYDADATQVKITLENVGKRGGTIIIEDNGHGMTFDEIENGWMRIASSGKRFTTRSRKYKRSLTGAKGIGRFATRRLGSELKLQSVVELINGAKEAIIVNFNWASFSTGANISDISVNYRREIVSSDYSTGVTLQIIKAHDAWDKDEIDALKRDLLGLVSPFPILQSLDERDRDPGFNILLDADEKEFAPDEETDLTQEFLDAAWAVLSASIDNDGWASYSLEFLRTDHATTQIIDDGEQYIHLAGVGLKIYFHQYQNKDDYAGLSFSVHDARRLGREQGGVRIFLDNFRIYPYGESSDDWVRLADTRSRNIDMANNVPMSNVIKNYGKDVSRPYLDIPGNNQLFGYVSLSQALHASPNKSISERLNVKASREGFVENQIFEQLRRFVQRGIYWLTMQYASIRILSSKAKLESPKTVEKIDETRKSLKELPERIANIVMDVAEEPKQTILLRDEIEIQLERKRTVERIIEAVTPAVDPIRENLEGVEQQHITEQQELISVIAMLRLLASAGASLLVMEHQFNPVLRTVSGIKADMRWLREQIPQVILPKYDRIIRQIEEWEHLVSAIITPLVSLLNPEYRERRRRWVTYEIVEEIHRALQHYMNEHQIEFENAVSPSLRTPSIYRAEIYSLLLNLLTNALKAVYGYPERRIRVEAFRTDDKLFILRMLNTGKKAPKDKWEAYFQPFISDSISNSGLGVGTGLGLSIVRDTINEYSGSVSFFEVENPWQTGVEIRLPIRGDE